MMPRLSRYGGVEGFGWRLAEALANKGYSVDFICARQETEAPEGVSVVAVGRVGGLKFVKMLWFLVRAETARRKGKYDLSVSLGKTWNQDIARLGGGPLKNFWKLSKEAWPSGWARFWKQFTRHAQPANWLTLFIEKRLYRKTPCIVAISDSVREWILDDYPHLADAAAHGQELLTIYNCPDVSRFRPPAPEERAQARESLGIAENTFALGLATTNFALKGVDPLIRSLSLLPADVHLHIAGGRNPGRYVRLASSLGLGGRVRFHGKIDGMTRFYHALDMYVHPTFYDTLGNVVLEALGSGLPVLCSSRAGAHSFLPVDQIIDNPSDQAEIAAKVMHLRTKKQLAPFFPRGAGVDELAALVDRRLARKQNPWEAVSQ